MGLQPLQTVKMVSTQSALRFNAAIYVGYGLGFMFAPSLMSSTYLKQPEMMNDHALFCLKWAGLAQTVFGAAQLAIADGGSDSMKKCILSILGVGNAMAAFLAFTGKDFHLEKPWYQVIAMQFGCCALNLFLGAVQKTKKD